VFPRVIFVYGTSQLLLHLFQTPIMPFNRRLFLQKVGMASAAAFASSLLQPAWSRNLEKAVRKAEMTAPDELASDEDFWYYIQQSFTVSPSIINLNNGGVSPAPKTVQDVMKRLYELLHVAGNRFGPGTIKGKPGKTRRMSYRRNCN
jgi:hypothetical protein